MAKEVAEHADGYSADGVSMATHAMSRKKPNAHFLPRVNKFKGQRRLDELIGENRELVLKIERKLAAEQDPERVARLQKSLFIKKRFLGRLVREWDNVVQTQARA
jgi:hypothetical protein